LGKEQIVSYSANIFTIFSDILTIFFYTLGACHISELGALAENGDAHREQQELMEKDKRDENNIKSDGDFSCLSSYQSHSTHSHHSKRRNSYDKMQFPRHDLQTLGMLGKIQGSHLDNHFHTPCKLKSGGIYYIMYRNPRGQGG
jgi:hypothetical protein